MEACEHRLGAVCVNAMKVVLWMLASVIAACGETRQVASSYPMSEHAVRQSPKDPGERLLKLRASERAWSLIGPNDRLFVRTVLDQCEHPGLLVYDLLQPNSPPRLLPWTGDRRSPIPTRVKASVKTK
jgi:hypothetical protein